MSLQTWALILLIVACFLVGCYVFFLLLNHFAKGAYRRLRKNPETSCDIESFIGPNYPPNALKVWALAKFQLGNRQASSEAIPIAVEPSPHLEGLWVARKSGDAKNDKKSISLDQFLSEQEKTPVVIATIRMGFGHHRIAYSAASWALAKGHAAIFHDMLSIESDEAQLISDTDAMYSKFSRLASEIGGPVEKLWGAMTMQGDSDALRVASLMAAHLQPLLRAYPRDTPIITSHQLCALTASAAGFTNVVNLVVDNHAQWFLTVPNTLNMVQGPKNYHDFLRMGIDKKELAYAGHWCPEPMVNNLESDCQRRINRRAANKPVRLLIPVGGAGAQKKYIISFIRELSKYVKDGKVQLFLNAGDHAHMKTAFLQVLDDCGLDFEEINSTEGTVQFQQRLTDGRAEPKKSVTLFAYEEYYPAVNCTDFLSRVSDVLCCKPSELAFYCVPRLHLRRVGDHEAESAVRSVEVGDGTQECREVSDAMDYVELFVNGSDLLTQMNECMLRNHKMGLYNGTKNAVDHVLEKKTD